MSVKVNWNQVLAWRLRRQYLDAPAEVSAEEVVSRLCGVQAQVASAAEMAVGLRLRRRAAPDIAHGLTDGSLMKTWAMRGTLHLLPAAEAACYLSLLAAARIWVKPTWQRAFGATPQEVEQLVEAVSAILDGQVLTRDELVQAVVSDRRFASMEQQLRSGWGALLKPLAWQGALCYGPARGKSVTFTSPASLVKGWAGVPDPDEAAPAVIAAYLGAFGPSTPEAFDAWLSRNSHKKTTLRRWFADMGDRLTEVDVEGERAYLCTEHVDELASTEPSEAVRLLGAFEYVLGPGTNDTHILAGEHRARVSRTAGWISPIVLVGGRITGVWDIGGGELVVTMFDGERVPTIKRLEDEAARVAKAGIGRLTVRVA